MRTALKPSVQNALVKKPICIDPGCIHEGFFQVLGNYPAELIAIEIEFDAALKILFAQHMVQHVQYAGTFWIMPS